MNLHRKTVKSIIRCIGLLDEDQAKEDLKNLLWLPSMNIDDKIHTIRDAQRHLSKYRAISKACKSQATLERIDKIAELLKEVEKDIYKEPA